VLVCVTARIGLRKVHAINDTVYARGAQPLRSAAEPAPTSPIPAWSTATSVSASTRAHWPHARSNPATYTDCSRPIGIVHRLPEARSRGYDAGRFSFNVKAAVASCPGPMASPKVEMHFLPDIYVPCDVCTQRYNRETLEVRYKGRNIHEVLR